MTRFTFLAISIVILLGVLAVTGCTYPKATEDYQSPWEKAKEAGIDLRAIGQEPGWYVEIKNGEQIHFVTDYGETQITAVVSEPEVDAKGVRTFRALTQAFDLMVLVEDKPHQDIMSGEEFPLTVTIKIGEQEYRGGGRNL